MRDIHVDHPLPATPRAGRPRLPYTSNQFPNRFTRLAEINVKTTGFTMLIACRYRRRTKYTTRGNVLQIRALRKGTVVATNTGANPNLGNHGVHDHTANITTGERASARYNAFHMVRWQSSSFPAP